MRRKFVPAVIVALAAAVVILLVYGLTKQGTSRALDAAVLAGRTPAAPLSARVLPVLGDGASGVAALAHWRGKVIVLNFWASWCSTCIDETPLIERAQRALRRSGAGTVIGIDYKDVSSDAQSFATHYGLSYPSLRDIDGTFASAYGTAALPETFVINRRMQIVAISRGEIPSEARLAGWIRQAERA